MAKERKINIKKDRLKINEILILNLPLMNKNKEVMCQEVADCILAYWVGAI